jgi:CO/xanthine dehydrogenase Mo-binding subunit
MNAVTDALGKSISMPATPEKVWRAMQGERVARGERE